MQDRELYAQILGLQRPWHVINVALDVEAETVEVTAEHRGEVCCPRCGKPCAGYDTRRRRWRHLDTCQFRTVLIADVPRVRCEEHGVVQMEVPWSEAGSRFTALFERVVIDWLKEASVAAVSRRILFARFGDCGRRRPRRPDYGSAHPDEHLFMEIQFGGQRDAVVGRRVAPL